MRTKCLGLIGAVLLLAAVQAAHAILPIQLPWF